MTNEDRFAHVGASRELSCARDLVRVFDALERRDDAMLWAAARLSESQEDFFDLLRTETVVSRYTTRNATSLRNAVHHYCGMVMMPIVLPPIAAALVSQEAAYDTAMAQMLNWMGEWWGHKLEVRMFNVPIGYEEIVEWSPSVMREKLEQLTFSRQPKLVVQEKYDVQLPDDAPALAFLVASVPRPLEPPELPPENPLNDATLTARVAGVLQINSPGRYMERTEVGVPAFASEAILQGLVSWIHALADTRGLGEWDATPISENTVMLQLTVGESEPLSTKVPLHAHQLGLSGLSAVLAAVKERALNQPTYGHTARQNRPI